MSMTLEELDAEIHARLTAHEAREKSGCEHDEDFRLCLGCLRLSALDSTIAARLQQQYIKVAFTEIIEQLRTLLPPPPATGTRHRIHGHLYVVPDPEEGAAA